jgi:fructose-bisphosphate aldolase, class I
MFDMVHEMRTRIIASNAFTGDHVLGAILFENTMDREIEGIPTGRYLWEVKGVVPFIKCDEGLAAEENGVQLMKPMSKLDDLLRRSKEKGFFGTKMRSLIRSANEEGIKAVVDQQFEIGSRIIAAGLVPIIEPEVDINSPQKDKCEEILKAQIMERLNGLEENQKVILKLSLPTQTNLYKDLVDHPNCIRVVALSGGYSRATANELLARQTGVVGSFSRALTEGLRYDMSDVEFSEVLGESIASIFEASRAG